MKHLPLNAVYESSIGRSTQFVDVVPDEFTVWRDPRFRTSGHGPSIWPETPVCEVKLLPPEEGWSAEVWAFLEEPAPHHQVSDAGFVRHVFGALMDAVEDAWEPDRFHYVLHSAGFDSRLLSLAIRELYRKNGPQWLGDVLFMECAGEGPWFRRVMEVEGWGKSQYAVYGEGWEETGEYYTRCLDFDTAGQRMAAGAWAWIVNHWWEPLDWAREIGLVPDDVQCWSAKGANRISAGAIRDNLREELRLGPYSIICSIPLSCEWESPFLDFRYARALKNYSGGRHYRGYINNLLDEIEPGLSGIPNPTPDEWVRFKLTDELFDKAVGDYRSSGYGRWVRPDVQFEPKPRTFEPWWGFYALASYCERAIRKGRQVHAA